jgi:D-alanine-D-alanine ligase
VAFLTLHGTFGEDGTVQRLLDREDVCYTGSSAQASAEAMDKVFARRCFEAAGLRVPRGVALDADAWRLGGAEDHRSRRVTGFGEVVVVKPSAQGSSLGVRIVPVAQAPEAIEQAFVYGSSVLIEEHVRGRELTVGILEERPLPVIEIVPHREFFDYTAKYHTGLTDYRVPAPMDAATAARVQDAARAAHRALGCRDCSRADLILTPDGQPVLLEVNTIPGFTSTSLLPKAAAAAGIAFGELCLRLVKMAQQRQRAVGEVGEHVASR